ncbi:MAG TPA: DNA polymerase III subunit beta [Rhabdochlamydiaceae bacterium]|nr:DNA polymerase III subunit beta [Rhabdochlamydiaceae bacterium]
MKVIISRADLVSLIGKIQSIVSPKPAIPILANVLIEAIDDQLIISATDLTVSMRAYAEAKVLEEGAITLPARRFFQLVRELTAPQVEIHSDSPEVAFINAGTSHFKIHGMHKSEFPSFPDLSAGAHFTIESTALKELLSRTVFAAAREDSRQVLNGILLQSSDGTATFIGTDGKRLAKLQSSVNIAGQQPGSYILPLKAVEEIIKILDSKEVTAKITLMADKASLETGSITLITKLLSGQYPDVSRVIPEKSAQSISLHREELISLLRQVSLFTSEASCSVRFSFQPGSLHLTAMSGDIGEGKVNMPVNYAGSKFDVAFNPNYFLDVLRHSKDETVEFDITDPYNPALITDSSNALFVIMPMRLES